MKTICIILGIIVILCAVCILVYTTYYAISLGFTIKAIVYLSSCTSICCGTIIYMIFKCLKDICEK